MPRMVEMGRFFIYFFIYFIYRKQQRNKYIDRNKKYKRRMRNPPTKENQTTRIQKQ